MYDDYGYDDRGYKGDSRDQYGPGYREESRQYHRAPPPPESTHRGPPEPYERPEPMSGKKKVSYKCIGGMVIAIVALILLFIFMSYPWYSISYHAEQEVTDLTHKENDFKMEYYRDKIKVGYETEKPIIGEIKFDDYVSYDDPAFNNSADDVKETMDSVSLIITITMIILILAIIVIPIAAIGKMPHSIGTIFLILAIVLLLVIPIYMYFNIPPAVEQQIDDMPLIDFIGRPMNETFKYNGEFLGSGKGTDYQDLDIPPDGEEEKIDYEMKWTPELGFWMNFVPIIIILVAQIVYTSGKQDIQGRRRPQDSYHRPPPPPRRGYDDRDRGRVRDHGPPRPMSEEDYNYIPAARRRPPPRDEYGYDSPPPPPRRRRREPSYDSPPPPPRRPPRQRRQDRYY